MMKQAINSQTQPSHGMKAIQYKKIGLGQLEVPLSRIQSFENFPHAVQGIDYSYEQKGGNVIITFAARVSVSCLDGTCGCDKSWWDHGKQ